MCLAARDDSQGHRAISILLLRLIERVVRAVLSSTLGS